MPQPPGVGTDHHCSGPKISKLKGNCAGKDVHGFCTKHQVLCEGCGHQHLKIEPCVRCKKATTVRMRYHDGTAKANNLLIAQGEGGQCRESFSCPKLCSFAYCKYGTRAKGFKTSLVPVFSSNQVSLTISSPLASL